ncbi:hypothetical protein WH47_10747 [Habropoda laboriosa]|uniref:Uncharacterized protein n=1 Tax=Habropoda laboriosa TaxID=597456 RepID=A0A0L7RC00_9HYME|nr:hypothetical protein WH47_10747 [Habropoda laboriosa]
MYREHKVLKEISANFHCSAEEIQGKIHNLRNQLSPRAYFETNCRKSEQTDTDESQMNTVITLFMHVCIT